MADAAAEVLPQSRRPDGTVRPQVRVKKGYVPPEEQETYDRWKSKDDAGGVPGAGEVAVPKPPMSKTAAKNAKRKAKRLEGGAPAADGVAPAPASSAAVVDVSDTTVSPAPAGVPASAAAAPAADAAGGKNELEKKLRALRKKLKTIEELEAKAAGGAELNEDQKSKIAAKGEIEAEVARWEAFGDADELAKEIKKLGKKMRQIEELEARAAKPDGEPLNADQLGKIAMKKQVIEDLKKLEELQSRLP